MKVMLILLLKLSCVKGVCEVDTFKVFPASMVMSSCAEFLALGTPNKKLVVVATNKDTLGFVDIGRQCFKPMPSQPYATPAR